MWDSVSCGLSGGWVGGAVCLVVICCAYFEKFSSPEHYIEILGVFGEEEILSEKWDEEGARLVSLLKLGMIPDRRIN